MFKVAITRDLRRADGTPAYDMGTAAFDAEPDLEWEFLATHEAELTPETAAAYDAVMVWEPGAITEARLAGDDRRLRHIARLGMGMDAVDLPACTRAGVIVTCTTAAVTDAVPSGAMAHVLALAHRLPEKDRILRAGRGWDDRFGVIGAGTRGRTIGIVGLGNVGRGVAARARPFELRCVAYDPYVSEPPEDVELAPDLETLLERADYVVITCPLTPETHHLIDAAALAKMRPGSYLVNVARGPIVDTHALAEAVAGGHLAGAGIDVFETEPLTDHPLFALDNVIVSPHAIAYTEPSLTGMGRDAANAVLALKRGETPQIVVNTDVLG